MNAFVWILSAFVSLIGSAGCAWLFAETLSRMRVLETQGKTVIAWLFTVLMVALIIGIFCVTFVLNLRILRALA